MCQGFLEDKWDETQKVLNSDVIYRDEGKCRSLGAGNKRSVLDILEF